MRMGTPSHQQRLNRDRVNALVMFARRSGAILQAARAVDQVARNPFVSSLPADGELHAKRGHRPLSFQILGNELHPCIHA
jgi:hypothetical protein